MKDTKKPQIFLCGMGKNKYCQVLSQMLLQFYYNLLRTQQNQLKCKQRVSKVEQGDLEFQHPSQEDLALLAGYKTHS